MRDLRDALKLKMSLEQFEREELLMAGLDPADRADSL
jgi:hypothetical protein